MSRTARPARAASARHRPSRRSAHSPCGPIAAHELRSRRSNSPGELRAIFRSGKSSRIADVAAGPHARGRRSSCPQSTVPSPTASHPNVRTDHEDRRHSRTTEDTEVGRVRKPEAAHPQQARRQARPVARRRAGRRRAAPRNPPGRRAPLRHRRHAAQPQRARAAGRRGARRDVRPRPAGDAAQGPDDQRYPDQRPEERLRRAPRQDGKDQRRRSATTTT